MQAKLTLRIDSAAQLRDWISIQERFRVDCDDARQVWRSRSRATVLSCRFRDLREAENVLNALAAWNSLFDLPHPYSEDADIEYRREIKEKFADARTILRVGHDDCDSLSAYLAGVFIRRMKVAHVRIEENPSGNGAHAFVMCHGRKYDPSVVLGMEV